MLDDIGAGVVAGAERLVAAADRCPFDLVSSLPRGGGAAVAVGSCQWTQQECQSLPLLHCWAWAAQRSLLPPKKHSVGGGGGVDTDEGALR